MYLISIYLSIYLSIHVYIIYNLYVSIHFQTWNFSKIPGTGTRYRAGHMLVPWAVPWAAQLRKDLVGRHSGLNKWSPTWIPPGAVDSENQRRCRKGLWICGVQKPEIVISCKHDDESWWIMMNHDESWCIMMHHDDSLDLGRVSTTITPRMKPTVMGISWHHVSKLYLDGELTSNLWPCYAMLGKWF